MAEALHAAHEQGVIHRDVKPANILMSKGRPLVADFGIALAVAQAGGGRLTETGLSMGTPYYMSPEQASADREPSASSDVYSLACVLYEMLVGDPPYTASSAQAVLAKILTEDAPAPTKARASIPPNVDAAIRKALEKLPADRFTGAQDFAEALDDDAFRYGAAEEDSRSGLRGWLADARSRIAIAVVAALVAIQLLQLPLAPVGATAPESRFPLEVPGGLDFGELGHGLLAVSPDGRVIVYGENGLLVRFSLDDGLAEPLPGTDRANAVFFSPDGEWIGFHRDNRFHRIPVQGGAVSVLGSTPADWTEGVDWAEDDALLWGRMGLGIWRYPFQGEEPMPITTPSDYENEHGHAWPQLVADGSILLYTAVGPSGKWHDARVIVQDMKTGERYAEVANATFGRYVDSGHIVYVTAEGAIQAVPFDLAAKVQTGGPIPVESNVLTTPWGGGAAFAVSRAGTLVFAEGSAWQRHLLVRVDREGHRLSQIGPPMTVLWGLETQPGGPGMLTALPNSRNDDVYLISEEMAQPQPVTSAPGSEGWPVWSPDGRRFAWAINDIGGSRILIKSIEDGGQPVELLRGGGDTLFPFSWSIGGWLAYIERRPGTGSDILAVNVDDPDQRVEVIATPGTEWNPQFSPGGEWIAYVTDLGGTMEVYVVPFPDPGASPPRPLSIEGGEDPRWSRSSNELFYWQDTTLMSVRFGTEGGLQPELPVKLFSIPDRTQDDAGYAVSEDGESFFIVVENPPATIREIRVVLNWFEKLNRLVPN